MTDRHLILASASPRRQQLLRDAGFDFEIRLRPVEERFPATLPVREVPEYLSRLKAEPFLSDLLPGEVLITADTAVFVDDEIIGKPHSEEEAKRMLHTLSGRDHTVISAVCLTDLSHQTHFSVSTKVWFKPLSEEEIDYYITTYRPFDKAGAYGIQEWIGYIGIERIEGSFYNVMGLPIQRLYAALQQFNQ